MVVKGTNRDPFATELVLYQDGTWEYITPMKRDKLRSAGMLEESQNGLVKVLVEPSQSAQAPAFGEAGALTKKVMAQKRAEGSPFQPKNYLTDPSAKSK